MMMKIVEAIFILAMLVPFATHWSWSYLYWIAIATTYLAYIALRRWEYE